ncbi:hypothetical protein P5P86_12085 [Nocardioides sp. BP30]|uniref:Ig-like domain repeat protein n=1 Tax=Nocardioides sp. BP30 TaxID=3036374 RepID=UPI0024689B0F|nr:Ig-like domain repeat protein [Nocardioides sp. BP30]WGL50702.1 hypothetical protein P5P86_12085 [Nocardioides sp. BP30]
MPRPRSLLGALTAASALVLSSFLVAAPAAHADDTGTLTVKVVDQYNHPTPALMEVLGDDGLPADSSASPSASASQSFALAAGDYGVLTLTTFSGFHCVGISPCGVAGLSFDPATALTVTAGEPTVYVMHVTVPSISGANAVGSRLSVHIPASLTAAMNVAGGGGPNYTASVTQQWMRGSVPIAGATGTDYRTVREDGSRAVQAQLTMTGYLAQYSVLGLPTTLTTNAVTMQPAPKSKTTTTIKVPKKFKRGQRVSAKVKVASPGWVVDGYVTVSIGKFKTKKTLKQGVAYVTLPHLKTGHYTIVTKYLGALYYQASKAKKTKITVH